MPMHLLMLFLVLIFSGCAASAPCRKPEALSQYLKLVASHPHIVANPGAAAAGEIELVLEPNRIRAIEDNMEARYRRTYDTATAHDASRAGLVMQDPYALTVREAVVFPNGATGLYRRTMSRVSLDGGSSGAYCLPVLEDGRVVLLREYRHQERAWRIGPPGGFREPGETDAMAAAREAAEETGLILGPLTHLATVDNEGDKIPIFVGRPLAKATQVHPDEGEALGGTVAWTLEELRQAILAGSYTDAAQRNYRIQGILGTAYVLLAQWQASQSEAPAR